MESLRVDAIGELKTRKVDQGHLNLTITFLADAREKLPHSDSRFPVAEQPPVPLDHAVQQKLDRQMKAMSKAMIRARDESSRTHSLGHAKVSSIPMS